MLTVCVSSAISVFMFLFNTLLLFVDYYILCMVHLGYFICGSNYSPHKSTTRDSSAQTADSDPIGEAGPRYFYLVAFSCSSAPLQVVYSWVLRPCRLSVIGIFHWHNPSGRTMALGSTHPLTELGAKNISWGKGGRCVGLTTLPLSCADCLKIWQPQPSGTLRACQGL
jgi:hypothetical protein